MGRRHGRVCMGAGGIAGGIARGMFSCRGAHVAVRFVEDSTFVAGAHTLHSFALLIQCFAVIAPRPFDSDFLVCIVKLIGFAACALGQARRTCEFPHLLACVF